jgi:peptidoglycan-associated lipoprotein
MKKHLFLGCTTLVLLSSSLTSCYRSRGEMWEDTKTCGRYLGKGVRTLMGRHVDSSDYANASYDWDAESSSSLASSSDNTPFVPLSGTESFQNLETKDFPISQESPGDPGSALPGIDGFSTPTGELANLFNHIRFDTDNYSVQGTENLTSLRTIANYLAAHPTTYVFVEGHADERGAAAYNLALASKRSNSVRNFLIENGANPDQLFTISYGLERPLATGHDEAAWKMNRRAQFRLYEQKR